MAGIPPYPPVPSPSVYADGPLGVRELRDDLTNGITFLANAPSFSAYSTGGEQLTGGTWNSVTMNTESWDTWGGYAGSLDPQAYYCQAAGWYVAEAYMPFSYTGTTSAQSFGAGLAWTTGGTASGNTSGQFVAADFGNDPELFAADLIQMTQTGLPGSASTDYVQGIAYTDGSAISLQAASPNYPRLSVRWAGTGSASSLAVPSNPAWPVPPSYLTAAFMNANISDALSFLANPPLLRYSYGGTTQTLASMAWANYGTITLNSAWVDNYSGWSGSYYSAPVPGLYYAVATVALKASNSDGQFSFGAGVSVGGTVTWGNVTTTAAVPSSKTVVAQAAMRLRLGAGDEVALIGFQESGNTLDVGGFSRLVLAWESA